MSTLQQEKTHISQKKMDQIIVQLSNEVEQLGLNKLNLWFDLNINKPGMVLVSYFRFWNLDSCGVTEGLLRRQYAIVSDNQEPKLLWRPKDFEVRPFDSREREVSPKEFVQLLAKTFFLIGECPKP